ncbi:MAG: hypothetical protein K0A99_10065 [Desulfoarculaceae bacterium]|nr:hypothetical protein [Desulfoarculaceae bacterium]
MMIPPKVSISSSVGTVKGRTAIRILRKNLIFQCPCR